MGLMDFMKKQFIGAIHCAEERVGVLSWRFPMAGLDIQYGAALTVGPGQMAVFVDEDKIADVFGPGNYTLTRESVPVLRYLKNWDRLFDAPFRSDVYFFSTRALQGQRWTTPRRFTVRGDGASLLLRAGGSYACSVSDPCAFHSKLSSGHELYTVTDLEAELRSLIVEHVGDAVAQSGVPAITLTGDRPRLAEALRRELVPAFEAVGLKLDSISVDKLALGEEQR